MVMKTFHILTLFPESCAPYLNASILGKAQQKKIIKINLIQIRDFAVGKKRQVDDSPYGGGPGMVMKVEPIYKAVQGIKKKLKKKRSRTILFSTRGEVFNQKKAKRLSKYDELILICGRYEGVDERVAEHVADEEISIGDFVLSGGELPALIVVDAVSRQFPGVLGKYESLEEIKGSYPVYTRPPIFSPKSMRTISSKSQWKIPKVLLSGDHKKIAAWRQREEKSRN